MSDICLIYIMFSNNLKKYKKVLFVMLKKYKNLLFFELCVSTFSACKSV